MKRTVPVTVVIPNYNSGTFLVDCIRSVNAGSRPEQILILDDASTDNSLSVARGLAHDHDNVEVIVCSENRGAAETRRRGIETAACEWIAFVDADDTIEEGAVATAYDTAVSTGSDLCVWQMTRTDGVETWPSVELSHEDFPMTGREAARRTLGAWRMHPLGVGQKWLFSGAYAGFTESGYNADELITRVMLLAARSISLCDAQYFYRTNLNSTTMALHPRRLGIVDAQVWLIRFALDNGFSRSDVVRVIQSSIGVAWWVFKNRRALGGSDAVRKVSQLTTVLGQSMHARDWLYIQPRQFVLFVFLQVLRLYPVGKL